MNVSETNTHIKLVRMFLQFEYDCFRQPLNIRSINLKKKNEPKLCRACSLHWPSLSLTITFGSRVVGNLPSKSNWMSSCHSMLLWWNWMYIWALLLKGDKRVYLLSRFSHQQLRICQSPLISELFNVAAALFSPLGLSLLPVSSLVQLCFFKLFSLSLSLSFSLSLCVSIVWSIISFSSWCLLLPLREMQFISLKTHLQEIKEGV